MGLHPVAAAIDRETIAAAIEKVMGEIGAEIVRATVKHGAEAMSMPGHDVGKRLGILVEEVGEVARATTYDNGNEANKREELIQTAAMAAAWVIADELAKTS